MFEIYYSYFRVKVTRLLTVSPNNIMAVQHHHEKVPH
jgi:hypothetical protein